jgi:proline iminopeptidase
MTHSKISPSDWKYPQPPLNRSGHLPVTDGHRLYWEEYGNPQGEPVLVVHGGPGGACSPDYARFFDPARYRIVLFDQRGCGKSSPSASDDDPAPALSANTTDDLIGDMNTLRDHLGIGGKMHLFGGSWGSTLSLAYAIKHPENVGSLNLRGIFLCRKPDLDYFYQGNAATYAAEPQGYPVPGAYISYPEAWKPYVEIIPPEKRHDMIAAYAEIFAMQPKTAEEKAYQDKAAIAWTVWEGSTSYLSQDLDAISKYADPAFAKAFAKIENHYFMNGGFLGGNDRNQNHILENLHRLKDIPVQVVHGRYDQVCPVAQAESLVTGLKAAGNQQVEYRITPCGHSMMERETNAVLSEFMDRLAPLGHAAKVKASASAERSR